ncbi:hyaluronidase-5-like [Lissotriton helveticus]
MKLFASMPNNILRRVIWVSLCLVNLVSSNKSSTLRAPPVVEKSPFITIWNAPTEECMKHRTTNLSLQLFQFVASPMKTAINQTLAVFYKDRLGSYPYIDETTGKSINGGLPQLIHLSNHLKKTTEDITFYMPDIKQSGFAVIDWEEWRPLWARNWAIKSVYQKKSIELILREHFSLSSQRARLIAKKAFEAAGRSVMEGTLSLGKLQRPARAWGFYLFPECYNYNYRQNPNNYTGSCPDVEKRRNDELYWLWKESTALYPSIYLERALKSSPNAALYSRHRIQEAKRVSTFHSRNAPLPIYVYTRPVFADSPEEFLSQEDLVNTVGESAALGVSGIVMWGGLNFSKNEVTCQNLDKYLRDVLNPYVINVTLAAKMCSELLCGGKGACARKSWNSNDYLHLNPHVFEIKTEASGNYSVIGRPTTEEVQRLAERFMCNCYTGSDCKQEANLNSTTELSICTTQDICITAGAIGRP